MFPWCNPLVFLILLYVLQEESLLFTIITPPLHGNIEINRGNGWSPVSVFTMTDIYENHISYLHDGTETLTDNFSFTVSDGTNSNFAAMQQDGHDITLTEPQVRYQQIISNFEHKI